MSLAVTVDIRDGLSGLMRRAVDSLSEAKLNKVIGRDILALTQSHFHALDSARANIMGGSRSHYYAKAAQLTRVNTDYAGVIILLINQIGMGLHYHGGTVQPVIAKFLAIPARAEAYGRRPREFSDLVPITFKSGTSALVQRLQSGLGKKGAGKTRGVAAPNKGETQGGGVFFWLVKSATFEPDPSVIPNQQAFSGQAAVTLTRVIEEIKRGSVGLN